jgi:transcriptional regulator GlxA family with amidase domain
VTALPEHSVPEHSIVVVAYDGIQALDLTGPHEVFAAANRVADTWSHPGPRYNIRVVSPTGATITTESGLRLAADPADTGRTLRSTTIDTLIIPGGDSALDIDQHDPVVAWVVEAGAVTKRLACVCTGVFVAAKAGLLDDQRVTSHWARTDWLAASYPNLTVEPDAIYVHDNTANRPVWTSAGVTAGIDLALAIVESDLGTEVAQEVARWLVVFLKRPGGQTQFAPTAWLKHATDGPIRQAQDLIHTDPARISSMAELANDVGLSARHFARRFQSEVGVSPSNYLEQVRLSAARQHLETTDDGLAVIAERCGFGSAETLRRAFHRRLHVSPDDYRRRFATSS